ncbi:hypothetical protein EVAR_13488_1 [Eumeta japonica]|uniref:Uncharacterized protein n=1 Tax=Eumeta variegata TaxID=151549 RepID=A0A4C1UY28_EUMVA|nr:hypothetical protein EVAR_13488_1 [Eumeta japonica]
MRSLCNICGVTLKDRSRNSDVRERCGLRDDVMTKVEKGVAVRWLFVTSIVPGALGVCPACPYEKNGTG